MINDIDIYSEEFVELCNKHGILPRTVRTRITKENFSIEEAIFGIEKKCIFCGKIFRTNNRKTRFCSNNCQCKFVYHQAKNLAQNPFREPTKDTLWLIPMWHSEGMTAKEIATMTNRDVSVVEDVLNGKYEKIV